MAKQKDQNMAIAEEDAGAVAARDRSREHQAALAAEDTAARVEIAKAATDQPAALVPVTVTKFGEGKVSTGVHVAAEGDVMAKRGERMLVHPDIASSLEERGFAEISE